MNIQIDVELDQLMKNARKITVIAQHGRALTQAYVS